MWMPAVASEGKLYERNALKFSAFIFVVRFPRNRWFSKKMHTSGTIAVPFGCLAAAIFYGSDQIFLSIGAQHADGQLAASQDNRLAQVFQHEAER